MDREESNRLFVGGLKRLVEKEEITAEFQKFGEITDVWVAKDTPGFAFVEYATVDQAREAMDAKHKTECFGTEIRVEFTKAKDAGAKPGQKPRLFVGGIKDSIEKEDLKKVFESFGTVTDVWIAHNPPGFAFVEFETMEIAERAVSELNGSDHFGGEIKVQITKGSRHGRRNKNAEADDRKGGARQSHRPNPYPDRRPSPSIPGAYRAGDAASYYPPPPFPPYYPGYRDRYDRGYGDPYGYRAAAADPYAAYRADPYGLAARDAYSYYDQRSSYDRRGYYY